MDVRSGSLLKALNREKEAVAEAFYRKISKNLFYDKSFCERRSTEKSISDVALVTAGQIQGIIHVGSCHT